MYRQWRPCRLIQPRSALVMRATISPTKSLSSYWMPLMKNVAKRGRERLLRQRPQMKRQREPLLTLLRRRQARQQRMRQLSMMTYLIWAVSRYRAMPKPAKQRPALLIPVTIFYLANQTNSSAWTIYPEIKPLMVLNTRFPKKNTKT